MKIYINSATSISPAGFTPGMILKSENPPLKNRYSCIEPDYDKILELSMTRRWSRILKMGMATALGAIKDAGNPEIDAIITGTGYGYTEDTIRFLSRMTNPEDRGMNPTAFIQSTYNTLSSLIALAIKNQGYNNTFIHSGFTFESVIEDAVLLLESGEARNILIGGIDELADQVYELLERIEKVRSRVSGQNGQNNGPGEGSSFFVLSDKPLNDKALELTDFKTFYAPADETFSEYLRDTTTKLNPGLILTGEESEDNGKIANSMFTNLSTVRKIKYTDFCGSYPTAPAFGLWFGCKILSGEVKTENRDIKSILIYNCFEERYHSFFLLKKQDRT
jgi:3-oxoacyl-[acyl-carrier-protein] synthase II